MTRRFQVGDRVRVIRANADPRLLGAVTMIVRGPFEYYCYLDCYEIDLPCERTGGNWIAVECDLAPVHDGDEKLSWSDERVVWKPSGVSA